MIRDKRLFLLVILVMTYGLFIVEAKHRSHRIVANDDKHRHRHRHESPSGRRNRHDLADRRSSSSWSQELEYEDDSLADREDRDDDEEEEEDDSDYDGRPYYERFYPRTSRIAVHGRMYDPRYPPGYHRGGYRGTGWYDDEEQRRRGSPRYPSGRSYELRSDRTRRRLGYSKHRDSDYDSAEKDELEHEKRGAYEGGPDGHRSWWKNRRKHRIVASRHVNGRKTHRPNHSEPSGRFDDWRRRPNDSSESRLSHSKTERRRVDNFDDYEYPMDDFDDVEDDEDEDEDEDNEDNEFYKNERKPPLKTYDDIIKRLTSDDEPTTPRPTIRRDSRNIESDEYTKREGLESFRYEPRNLTRPLSRDRGKIAGLPYVNGMPGHRSSRRFDDNLPGKLASPLLERKSSKNVSSLVTKSVDRIPENKAGRKINDTQPRTRSLEQDYDEYLNTPDNEEELIKAGVEEDTDMQADINNTVSVVFSFFLLFILFLRRLNRNWETTSMFWFEGNWIREYPTSCRNDRD
ncbi:hypothetical protein K0M31_004939 [Melipona bicolor]|uniref:Uncharacterized protein n=1 Tax=Melipona bicolor TaxID=60889 RepID=A0AA40FVU1_9HYME|nr:hypothetical protein K0M31_004939 [Melipona bicolor]